MLFKNSPVSLFMVSNGSFSDHYIFDTNSISIWLMFFLGLLKLFLSLSLIFVPFYSTANHGCGGLQFHLRSTINLLFKSLTYCLILWPTSKLISGWPCVLSIMDFILVFLVTKLRCILPQRLSSTTTTVSQSCISPLKPSQKI